LDRVLTEIEYRARKTERASVTGPSAVPGITGAGLSQARIAGRLRPYLESHGIDPRTGFCDPARVASVIGATLFDRVFHRRFAETDGPLLYVYSRDQQSATEMDDDFSPSLNCEGEHPLAVGLDCEVECDSGSIVSLSSAHCCCGSQGCSNNV
jgi:hypothetical protein